jgi:TonB family protein
VFLISVALHALILLLFWDSLIGAIIEKDETVTVRMVEEEQEEPKKLRPKVIAQRSVDTTVRRFKEIVQPQVVELRPTPVVEQLRRVEVDPLEMVEAPKELTQRQVEVHRASVFADVPRPIAPVEVDVSQPTLRRVDVTKATAGPRKLEAAGPRTSPTAVDVQASTVREGIDSSRSVEGSYEGIPVALESGASDRYLHDDGAPGVHGAAKDCMRDAACRAYLKMIRDRVYSRWRLPSNTTAGAVRLRFRIDRGGSAHGIQLVSSDDSHLGETCLTAFRHASPFPPPPKEIEYLINKGLIATFDYGQ